MTKRTPNGPDLVAKAQAPTFLAGVAFGLVGVFTLFGWIGFGLVCVTVSILCVGTVLQNVLRSYEEVDEHDQQEGAP